MSGGSLAGRRWLLYSGSFLVDESLASLVFKQLKQSVGNERTNQTANASPFPGGSEDSVAGTTALSQTMTLGERSKLARFPEAPLGAASLASGSLL
jgi:hypothetical protein